MASSSDAPDTSATRDLDTIVDDLDGREFEIGQGDGSSQTIRVKNATGHELVLVDGDEARRCDPDRISRIVAVTEGMIQPEGHLPHAGGATAFVESLREWSQAAQEVGF